MLNQGQSSKKLLADNGAKQDSLSAAHRDASELLARSPDRHSDRNIELANEGQVLCRNRKGERCDEESLLT